MKITYWLAALVALCPTLAANAQKVYRCGPDGRIYQQTACAEGKAVDASDARTAEQRQAAQAVAKHEAKVAAQFDGGAASGAKSSKAKPAATAPAPEKATSVAKASSDKTEPASKPMVYLVPKSAASAPKP